MKTLLPLRSPKPLSLENSGYIKEQYQGPSTVLRLIADRLQSSEYKCCSYVEFQVGDPKGCWQTIRINLKRYQMSCLMYSNSERKSVLDWHYAACFSLPSARFIRPLSNRSALKGITFLSIFVYKYLADTSFIFISCLSTSFGLVSTQFLLQLYHHHMSRA